jgi:nicotinamidase-related amidase
MRLATLDPIAALIVVDLQNGVVALPTVHPAEEVVANSARLAAAFRAKALPVVLVNVDGTPPGRTDAGGAAGQLPSDWAELVPELDAGPEDHLVTKRQWGAFHRTSLDEHLRRKGVTQVVITGIATSLGVESTARDAHGHGYNVVAVTDAMTDLNAAAHRNSLEWVFPMLGETTTTDELLAQLQSR